MSFQISEAADRDVASATRFYNSRPGRYGAAFRAEFAKAARAIAANPRLYSPVEDGVPGREIREYYIKRFRQRVIYSVRDDVVTVIAVIHASSPPEAWHDRLPSETPPEAPQ